MTFLEARVHNLEVALMTIATISAELMPEDSKMVTNKILAAFYDAGHKMGTFKDTSFVVGDTQLELDLGDPS